VEYVVASLMVASGFCYGILAVRFLRPPREPGQLAMALVGLGVSVWVLGGAAQLVTDSYLIYTLGRLGHICGAAFVPVGLAVAFRAYTRLTTTNSNIVLMMCLPVCSMLFAGTNQFHQLMWSMPDINSAGEFLARPDAWGPWYRLVHAPYSVILTMAAILGLIMHSANVGRSGKRSVLGFSVAAVVPVAAIVAFDLGYGSRTVPYVPIVLAIMMPVFAWLILGARAIEFSPISYETVFRNIADPVVVLDDKGRVASLNRGAEKLFDIRETGAFRRSLEDVFGTDVPEVLEAIATGEPQRLTTRTGRFMHIQSSPIRRESSNEETGRVLMFHDVSDVERAESELRSSQVLLRTLFDHSVNGLVRLRRIVHEGETEPVLTCVSVNAAAARFLNTGKDEVVDMTVDSLLSLATGGMKKDDAASVHERFHIAIANGRVIDTEVRPAGDQHGHWLRMIGEPVADNVAVTFIDVSNSKAREEQMESMAATDPLTGILNRRGFEESASRKLAQSGDDATGALLFIDLNQFKQVNDRCGHDAGDELLRTAAQRLRMNLRSCDIIGRPGGDEFVALVPDVAPDVAERLAERLTEALEQPYSVGDDTLQCSASIGLALYPDNAQTLTGLLRAADEAMYRAKTRVNELQVSVKKRLLEKAG